MDELDVLTERLDEIEHTLVQELSLNSDSIAALVQKQSPFVEGTLGSIEKTVSTAEKALDFDLNCDSVLKAAIQRKNIQTLLDLLKREQIKQKYAAA
jgi:hypothetical protein